MKQVEWVEAPSVKIGTSEFFPGDKTTLEDGEADQYIAAGWCKCAESGDIGTRVAGAVKMEVQNTYQASR